MDDTKPCQLHRFDFTRMRRLTKPGLRTFNATVFDGRLIVKIILIKVGGKANECTDNEAHITKSTGPA